MANYTLSSVLIAAAAMPMPSKFAIEWEAVVEALIDVERVRVRGNGGLGAYRVCGTAKQFKTMFGQAGGELRLGIAPLFQRLRELVQFCKEVEPRLAVANGEAVECVGSYRVRWDFGDVTPIMRAACFVADFKNLDVDAALAEASGNVTPRFFGALCRLPDYNLRFWEKHDPFPEGRCYKNAFLLPIFQGSDYGEWPFARELIGMINVFAMTRPVGAGKWHVLQRGETLDGTEIPLGSVPHNDRVGGFLGIDGVDRVVKDLSVASHPSYSSVESAGRVSLLAALCHRGVAFTAVNAGFQRLASLVGPVEQCSPTFVRGTWPVGTGYVTAMGSEAIRAEGRVRMHTVVHPVVDGFTMVAVIFNEMCWVVNGRPVGGHVSVIVADDTRVAFEVGTPTKSLVYWLVAIPGDVVDIQDAATIAYDWTTDDSYYPSKL